MKIQENIRYLREKFKIVKFANTFFFCFVYLFLFNFEGKKANRETKNPGNEDCSSDRKE
jgi:hypothetical protein